MFIVDEHPFRGDAVAALLFDTLTSMVVGNWDVNPSGGARVADLPRPARHVAATYLEEVNAPLRVRQHRLGHAPQGVTLRTYTHVPDDLDRAVADRLDVLFAEACGTGVAGDAG